MGSAVVGSSATVLRRPTSSVGAAMLLLLGAVAGCRPKAAPSGDYHAARARALLSLDAVDDAAWGRAERIAWGPAEHGTAFRDLWSDAGLFVRFDVDDSAPWHTKARHDDELWEEEVVEIFLQPHGSGGYGEVEISPGNVTCDVWVTPPPRKFDISWNLDGLESRVTMQSDQGRTTGWSAALFMPWVGFGQGGQGPVPHPRDRWRFNVFRIERPGGPTHAADGVLLLAWSPTGQSTFHVPEAFRGIVFDD